jgi:DNA-binding MarR family transcriptional regulator
MNRTAARLEDAIGLDSPGLPAAMQELIGLAGAASDGAWLRLMQRLGLTPPQFITLNVLAREHASTVSALASRLRLTRGTVSHLVERLVQMRLVTRREVEGDRRQKKIELTARGRKIVERLRAERRADFSRAFERVSPPSRERLEAAVRAVNLELRRDLGRPG